MSDEVYIVTAYTPDVEREELLRKLVDQLHSAKKDILLITHSVTPNDIVKKCKYYIYDEENKILLDDKYKLLAWNTSISGATVRSKDVGKTHTTLLAVYKLLLYGFGFAKMVGYKYAHYLEYDSEVVNFDIFQNNIEILKDHSCVTYTNVHGHPIGFYFAFNLNDYSYDDLKYDEQKFLSKFIEHYPTLYLVEELTRIFFMDAKKTFYKSSDVILSEGLIGSLSCLCNSKTKMLSWAVPIVEDDDLYLFITEFDGKPILVEYIINDMYRKVELSAKQFIYVKIHNWSETKFLKILVNKKPHLEYDLTRSENRIKLTQNNFIERHK
jgi:hypothetical protein